MFTGKLKQEVNDLKKVVETLHVQLANALNDVSRLATERDALKLHNAVLRENIRSLNSAVVRKHYSNRKLKEVLTELNKKPAETKEVKAAKPKAKVKKSS